MNNKRKLEVGVKAIIVNKKGEILLIKRSQTRPNMKRKKWDIPGGRMYSSETLQKALTREIKEETALQLVKIIKLVAAQDIMRLKDTHTVRLTFLTRCKGKIKLSDEHEDYRWVKRTDLKKYLLDSYFREVMKTVKLFS